MNRLLNKRLRSSVVVSLRSGEAFCGILFAHDRRVLVLRNVEHLAATGERVVVDGEVILRWDHVDFIQVPRS